MVVAWQSATRYEWLLCYLSQWFLLLVCRIYWSILAECALFNKACGITTLATATQAAKFLEPNLDLMSCLLSSWTLVFYYYWYKTKVVIFSGLFLFRLLYTKFVSQVSHLLQVCVRWWISRKVLNLKGRRLVSLTTWFKKSSEHTQENFASFNFCAPMTFTDTVRKNRGLECPVCTTDI